MIKYLIAFFVMMGITIIGMLIREYLLSEWVKTNAVTEYTVGVWAGMSYMAYLWFRKK